MGKTTNHLRRSKARQKPALLQEMARSILTFKNKEFVEKKPCDVFDLIVGSGIGGFIATLLASPFELGLDDVGVYLGRVVALLFSRSGDTPVARTEKLSSLMKEIVLKHHKDKSAALFQCGPLQPKCTAVVIVAPVDNSGNSTPFCTWSEASRRDSAVPTVMQVLQATVAYEGLVSHANIGRHGAAFIATAMNSGNPTKYLRHYLQPEVFALFGYPNLGLLLSLGGGHPDTISLPPGNSKDILPTLRALSGDCEVEHQKSYQHYEDTLTPNPFRRLSVEQGMHQLNRDSEELYGMVSTHTSSYLDETDSCVDLISKFLARRILDSRPDHSKRLGPPDFTLQSSMNPVQISAEAGLKLLALDGGGLLGFSELLILQRVMSDVAPGKRPHEVFDLIAGSGSGGLIALLLGRFKLSVNEAIDKFQELNHGLWEEVEREEVADTTAMTNAFESKLYQAGYRDAPMRDQGCKTFVLVNVSANMNAKTSFIRATYDRSVFHDPWTVVEAIRATTAMRHIFTDATVGKGWLEAPYCGTDYANNNPTPYLLNEALSLFPETALACVVSIGTGHPGVISMRNGSLLEVMKRICRDCEQTHQEVDRKFQTLLKSGPKASHNPYFRFSVKQGMAGSSPYLLSDAKAQAAHAAQYLNQGETKTKLRKLQEVFAASVLQSQVNPWHNEVLYNPFNMR